MLEQEKPGVSEESCLEHLGDWRRKCLLAMGGVGKPGECTRKAEPKACVFL